MRKVYLFVLLAMFTFPSISLCFDSSYVYISSPNYDYKNPTFKNNHDPFNYDYEEFIFFERHNGSSADLIARKFTFNTEGTDVVIVSNGALNINPSFTDNMVVWQSNINGNWDIFYSTYNGNIWSAPMIVDSSLSDETDPQVHFTNYVDIRCLIYQKENDIYFRRYWGGNWLPDTNLTGAINEDCNNALLNGSYNNMGIYFLKEVSPGNNDLMQQHVHIDFPTYAVQFSSQTNISYIDNPRNLRLSSGYENLLNYERDTLGETDCFAYELYFNHTVRNFSLNYPGSSLSGMGSYFAMVIDNNVYNYFFSYAFINKYQDSTFLIATRWKNVNNLLGVNKIYIGDSSVNYKFALNRPVRGGQGNYNAFKKRLVWEKELNGKTALYVSDNIDFMTNFGTVSTIPNSFSLHQNYPNPFNPSTKIKFDIPKGSLVKLKIYDMLGREVAVLVNEKLNPGTYEYEWNGVNMPSGVYFCKIEAENFIETKRMVLVK